jgi:hypothetical protein
MAQDSWPSPNHNSRNVTDAEYEKISARFSDDGVWGDPTDAAVVSAGTGLEVTIRSGVYASVRGHAWYSGTVDDTLTVAANSSGSTRTDWVVLQLDRSTWDVRAVVKTGPTTLTQNTGDTGVYEIPLALVRVISGATSVTVTRGETYIGGRIHPTTSAVRPSPRRRGDLIFETDTGKWLGWDGSSWVTIYEDSGEITLGAGFSTWEPETECVGRKKNGVVTLRCSYRRVSSTFLTSDPDGSKLAVVPAALRHGSRWQFCAVHFTNGVSARVEVHTNGEMWVKYPSANVPANRVVAFTLTYNVDD